MANSETTGGAIAIVMLIGTIAAIIGSGYYAWQWTEPDSFFDALKFLILWAILGYVADLILVTPFAVLARLLDEVY